MSGNTQPQTNHLHDILADCHANGITGQGWKTALTGLWFSPAVRVLCSHRLQYRLRKRGGIGRIALARFLYLRSISKWGCDIGNRAEVAAGVHLPHTTGIVIGNNVTIESGCAIYQNVTLGERKAKPSGKRLIIRTGATIYAQAIILGPLEIGEGAVIGAQALVIDDVPAHTVVKAAITRPEKQRRAA